MLSDKVMPRIHEIVSVEGTVTDLFGHRFVVETAEGRLLADLGPKGEQTVSLKAGDRVRLSGERKPSEVKVRTLTVGGRDYALEPKPRHNAEGEHAALAAVKAIGFEPVGRPVRKPRHFEIVARRGDEHLSFHVEPDGAIRKTRPARQADRAEAP